MTSADGPTPRRLLLLAAVADVLGGPPVDLGPARAVAETAGPAAVHRLRGRAAAGDAGTGTPIAELRGVAKDRAIRSNLGGGRQDAGGGGIPAGDARVSAVRWRTGLAAAGVLVTLEVAAKIGARYAQLWHEDRALARVDDVDGELIPGPWADIEGVELDGTEEWLTTGETLQLSPEPSGEEDPTA